MTRLIQNASTKDKFGPSLTMRPSITERIQAHGLWHVGHKRPVNDANLRRAVEFVEMEAALSKAGLLGKMKLLRDIKRIGLIQREELEYDDDGHFHNLVVNVGLDELLDAGLSNKTPTAAWYLGLKDTGSPAAGDTMASHGTWATISPYSNGTDPSWTDGGVSGQSVDNVGNEAQFNINATDDVYGAFLKDDSTVDVATGLLYAAGDFAAQRSVQSGDTLEVTATFTAS